MGEVKVLDFVTRHDRFGRVMDVEGDGSYWILWQDGSRGRYSRSEFKLTPPVATGPQRSDSGAPNPETNLVTVELTREEAEVLIAPGQHPRPVVAAVRSKLRASLERTGK